MIYCWKWLLTLPQNLRWILLGTVFLVWTGLCWWPVYEADSVSLMNDKLAHMIGNFGLLGVLIIARQHLSLVRAVVFVCAYSLAIELVQIPIPGRFFDVFDMLANAGGALVAALLVNYLNAQIGARSGLI